MVRIVHPEERSGAACPVSAGPTRKIISAPRVPNPSSIFSKTETPKALPAELMASQAVHPSLRSHIIADADTGAGAVPAGHKLGRWPAAKQNRTNGIAVVCRLRCRARPRTEEAKAQGVSRHSMPDRLGEGRRRDDGAEQALLTIAPARHDILAIQIIGG